MAYKVENLAVGQSKIRWIELKNLEIENGFNKRLFFGDLDELSESIRKIGFLENHPIEVIFDGNRGAFLVRSGHRRFLACQKILASGEHFTGRSGDFTDCVPVITQPKNLDRKIELIRMIRGNEGLRFNAIEEGRVFAELREMGQTIESISNDLGYSSAFVSKRLALLELPASIQRDIMEGKINVTSGIELAEKRRRENTEKKELREQADKIKGQSKASPGKTKEEEKNAEKSGTIVRRRALSLADSEKIREDIVLPRFQTATGESRMIWSAAYQSFRLFAGEIDSDEFISKLERME